MFARNKLSSLRCAGVVQVGFFRCVSLSAARVAVFVTVRWLPCVLDVACQLRGFLTALVAEHSEVAVSRLTAEVTRFRCHLPPPRGAGPLLETRPSRSQQQDLDEHRALAVHHHLHECFVEFHLHPSICLSRSTIHSATTNLSDGGMNESGCSCANRQPCSSTHSSAIGHSE